MYVVVIIIVDRADDVSPGGTEKKKMENGTIYFRKKITYSILIQNV